jgi:hypothetical protein
MYIYTDFYIWQTRALNRTSSLVTKQIENKFLDALCGYYKVDDEDELPAEVQEISLGEMFEAEKTAAEMRAKMVRSRTHARHVMLIGPQ